MSIAIDHFPIPAPAFNGRSRVVPAENAFAWLQQAWAIFMLKPWLWMAGALLLIVASIALASLGLVGEMAFCLLAPLLGAGSLLACQRTANGERLDAADSFSGFRARANDLVILGLLLMGAKLLSDALAASLLGGPRLAILLKVVFLLPLSMFIWFAPALVFFNRMPPLEALKASFDACLKNALPLLAHGLVVMVLAFFAALPVGLGFLVLIPVLSGSVYVSYRDIFVAN